MVVSINNTVSSVSLSLRFPFRLCLAVLTKRGPLASIRDYAVNEAWEFGLLYDVMIVRVS